MSNPRTTTTICGATTVNILALCILTQQPSDHGSELASLLGPIVKTSLQDAITIQHGREVMVALKNSATLEVKKGLVLHLQNVVDSVKEMVETAQEEANTVRERFHAGEFEASDMIGFFTTMQNIQKMVTREALPDSSEVEQEGGT